MLKHSWVLFMDIIENWPALLVISGLLSWSYRRFLKRQHLQFKEIQVHIKRIEVLQAIDHDYGLQIVSALFDEYEELGGNHYLHAQFEKYKKMKMEETK